MDSELRRRAEEAFVEYLALSQSGAGPNFDAYCEQFPALDETLRDFHRQHQNIQRILKRSAGLSAEKTVPKETAPFVSLQSDSIGSSEMLDRLWQHAPRTNRYEVNDEVARGGMGVIFKVWDPDLRRTLAMKTLLSETSDRELSADGTRERLLARFLEEAQITGQLEHPGIVPVHDLGLDPEGKAYFTMPLVRGRDFKEVIKRLHQGRDGWTRTKALRVIMKVCEAMAYAHSRDVIHRDLKPSNVMVGRFGETYVLDWGLARVMSRPDSHDVRIAEQSSLNMETDLRDARASESPSPLLTRDGAVIGTPGYMAPEQARGRIDELDARTDVYSIGAMLYHVLTGRMPYAEPEKRVVATEVLTARLAGPPRPLLELVPDVPPDLISICEKAMATDPKRRYATALELADDIERYMTDRPVTAQVASRGHHLALAYRRNRGLANTIALAGAVLAVVLYTSYLSRSQARQRRFDVISARALPVRAAELFPAFPAAVPGLNDWLTQADELSRRKPYWEAELSQSTAESRAEIESVLTAIERVRSLQPGVQARLALARSLEGRDHRQAWDAAIEAIAASPIYARLRLDPIEGLVPLGQDPASGLWEFWNVVSGHRPAMRDSQGAIRPDAGDGVVLVLIPGRPGEGESGLPFLIGKFEVTQAQWVRVMGSNPSLYWAGLELPPNVSPENPGYVVTDLHPVDSLSWVQAREFAGRIGLDLIAGEEWEHACRGGAETEWIWGDAEETLESKVNLADRSAIAFRPDVSDWNDGYAVHAPVGSYPPNGFGLHDMDGNIAEWTGSWHLGDWIGQETRRIIRGASYTDKPDRARITWTGTFDRPESSNYRRGVRVGLPLAGRGD